MSAIPKSVIYDDGGNPVLVVVPYDEWVRAEEALTRRGQRKVRAGALDIKLSWPEDPVAFQRDLRRED